MEIEAGERACYNLLAFICLKMELHWRNYRVFVKLLNVLLTFSSHLYSKPRFLSWERGPTPMHGQNMAKSLILIFL